jgi:hypothetical protein
LEEEARLLEGFLRFASLVLSLFPRCCGGLFATTSTARSKRAHASGNISLGFSGFGAFGMSNPWDRPPIPTHGDSTDDRTYAGVGRVVTEWEHVELELGYLYSLFVGKHAELEGVREYGSGAVFAHRVETLTKAHERFAQSLPSQELEAEFFALINRIKKFSDRRNDVAHGVVRPIEWTRPPDPHGDSTDQSFFGYCLVPPNYKGKHFDPNNLPSYVYTYDEMLGIQGQLYAAAEEIIDFRYRLNRLIEDKKPRQ